MSLIKNHYGAPSYCFENKEVTVHVTVQGAQLTACFHSEAGEKNPFFIAPWYNEDLSNAADGLQVFRGSLFCMPYGGNAEPFEGKTYEVHGKPFNGCWDKVSFTSDTGKTELHLELDLDLDEGKVDKILTIKEGQPVIYERDIVSGIDARMPVAFHPTLQLPTAVHSALLDISSPIACYTPPIPAENPAEKGYALLKSNVEVNDITKAPCIDGSTVNLMSCPITKGYEDVVYFINDTSKDFCYSAITYQEEGYLYFQLKNPRLLSGTMLWMSNGGRYYEPWSGRINAVLGLEEVCSYFHYGIADSVQTNAFQEKGYKTYVDFQKEKTTDFRIIMGLISVEKGYPGVQDIIKKDEHTITIIGRDGSKKDVSCELDFLKE